MSDRPFYKPFLLLVVVAMLGTSTITQRALNEDRVALGLTRAEPLENAPPVLAFTTVALGGFRGLIANVLWLRANSLQQDGKYFEMVQLSDWITKLQPHFAMVWRHQAWNMAYNISIKFPDQNDRWMWVRRGLELLRDEGIRFNPHEVTLYQELGWFYQHKIGQDMDDGHLYYKLTWAYEMTQLLGDPPYNFDRLSNPKTPEDIQRAKTLRETYKLNPDTMQQIDRLYGPLDWRMPETHAIYWGFTGEKQAPKGVDLMPVRRLIYQSMQLAFHRGRLVINHVDGKAEFAPNVDIVDKVNASYEQMVRHEHNVENIRQGHQNFLKSAVSTLYLYNREAESARYWRMLKEKYPETVDQWRTYDEYSIYRVTDLIMNEGRDKILATIEGLLVRSYTLLAVGESERAAGYERMANKVWELQQKKVDVEPKPDIKARLDLGPFADIKRRILQDLLNPERGLMSAPLALQLRTELGLPPPKEGPKTQVSLMNPDQQRQLDAQAFLAENAKKTDIITRPSGLQYRVIEAGNGPRPGPASRVQVRFWGRVGNGPQFANTYQLEPLPDMDVSSQIAGWREALTLMPEGSRWQIFVPPHLGYGVAGRPPVIPPNALLVFEIQLVKVK